MAIAAWPSRQWIIALALAVLLPVVSFIAGQSYYVYRDEQRDIEAATAARAEQIVELVDARLRAEIGTLQALATATSLTTRDIAVFQDRARRVREVTPSWATVTLLDPATDTRLVNLARPDEGPSPAQITPAYEQVKRSRQPIIGEITEAAPLGGELTVPVYLPVLRDDALRYVLLAGISPAVFQEIMLRKLPQGAIGGIVDRAGRFIGRTVRYDEMVGKLSTEFVRKAIATGTHGIYRGVTHEGVENYTAFHTSPMTGWSVHLALDAALIDSPRRWSNVSVVLGGLGTLGLAGLLIGLVLRDMAARHQAEEAMQQMQRLNALSNMTGGVAHDFNNLLAIVLGNADILRRRGQTDSPQLEAIRTAARRGERLIRQLLAFSRQQPLQAEAIDVNARIRDMQEIIKRFLRDDIELKLDLAGDLWPIEVDPVQLETALINLAVNARDAMSAGGALTVETRNAPPSPGHPAGEVWLTVRDTGAGIPPEIVDRVFEPFFTTKETGKGTGLGLSMVHGFVQQSKGSAEITSRPGQGTAVKLRFPRAAAIPAAPSEPASAPAPSGRGHILVVEDDADVGVLAAEMLQELGYTVDRARNATEALAIVEDGRRLDLVFSDMVMPGGMNGLALARELRQRRPRLSVLLTTGYGGPAGEPVAAEGFAVLPKPYTIETLAEAVRRAIGAPSVEKGPKPVATASGRG